MRRRNLLLIAALVPPIAVYCSRNTPPVANGDQAVPSVVDAVAIGSSVDVPPPPPDPGAPSSLFHVFVVARSKSEESVPLLHLCPLRGATWLCGNSGILVVRNGTVENEPAFEVGLPTETHVVNGGVEVLGQWPDNAWLLLDQSDLAPPVKVAIYRWDSDRWRVVVPAFSTSDVEMSVVPWGRGGALMLHHDGHGEVRFRGLGTRVGSHPRLAPMPRCMNFPDHVGSLLAFDDGSIEATVLDTCGRADDVVQRWSSPLSAARIERFPLLDGATRVFVGGLSGDTPDDVTAWGVEIHGATTREKKPYLAHYDGHVWTKLDVPSEATGVNSWVRDAKGTTWIIAQHVEHAAVWVKPSAGAWTTVALPVVCKPSMLSKAADESVWAACWENGDLTLLSTATPSRVVHFGPPKPGSPMSP